MSESEKAKEWEGGITAAYGKIICVVRGPLGFGVSQLDSFHGKIKLSTQAPFVDYYFGDSLR